jgi:hypothetical protein
MLDRAASVAKLAEMAQVNLVNQLEKKKIELDMKKTELLDMSPDNRYSLKPGLEFKADAWIQEYQTVCLHLINLEIELKVAQETTKELFTEGTSK